MFLFSISIFSQKAFIEQQPIRYRNINYFLQMISLYNIFLSKHSQLLMFFPIKKDSEILFNFNKVGNQNPTNISVSSSSNIMKSNLENNLNMKNMLSESIEKQVPYNDMVYNDKIYAWRRVETGPIVKVFTIKHYSDVHPTNGSRIFKNIIQVEKIIHRISEINEFSIEQMIFLLKKMMEGYQLIYKKIGAVSVSLNKCGINSENQIKVWINEELFRNDISGEILNTQNQIVSTILTLLRNHTGIMFKHFWEYADSALRYSRKNSKINMNQQKKIWTFQLINNIISSFCQCLHLKMPQKIKIQSSKKGQRRKSCEEQVNSLLQSHCSNLQSSILLNPLETRKQNSLIQSIPVKQQKNMKAKKRVTSTTCSSARDQLLSSLFSDKTLSRNNHGRYISSIVNLIPNEQKSFQKLIHSQEKQTLLSPNLRSQLKTGQIKEVIEDEPSQKQISQKNKLEIPKFLSREKKNKSKDKLQKQQRISPQYNYAISKQKQFTNRRLMSAMQNYTQKFKTKNSQVSTTNGSSLKGKCIKGFKDSIMTIKFEDQSKSKSKRNYSEKTKCRSRVASEKQNQGIFQQMKQTHEKIEKNDKNKKISDKKNILYSCTNWRNQVQKAKKLQKQNNSFAKNNTGSQIERVGKKKSFILNKPALDYFKVLVQRQLESYETTENNSKNSIDKKQKIEEQKLNPDAIFQRFQDIKQNLFTSTYIQQSSDKKINSGKRIKQEKQSSLFAKFKQQQIIKGNDWTKKLQGLLGSVICQQQLKESINCGEQISFLKGKDIKLSMLGKLGRQIGRSVIHEEFFEY